jgi:hypothetical protein
MTMPVSIFDRRLLAAAALLAAAGASLPAGAAIKCWTNAEGVRECGESVPPEFAQQGHETIKKSGAVQETERAKTPEELEAAKVQAQEEAKAKQAQEDAARQDETLLATYTSTEDIERARDDQIAALDSTIHVTKTRNAKIQQDLDKRIEAAAAEERAGKSPNDALLKDIESLRRQVANNDEFVETKKQEQEKLRQQYAAKIERFKELKGQR